MASDALDNLDSPDDPDDPAAKKRRVRAERMASRATVEAGELKARAHELGIRIADEAESRGAETVSLYVSVGNEPGTHDALDRLHDAGIRILLPVVVAGLELDWAVYAPGELVEGRRGLLEPAGSRLGLDAIAEADVVFCPGLAGSPDGRRLGQGGACYDKALPRANPQSPRLLVVYDEDVIDDVPTDERDQRVDAIVTPTRTHETYARLS
jgi:5-formyltetrahydrofolate cyclo-ligase